jgi:hypothetical protein
MLPAVDVAADAPSEQTTAAAEYAWHLDRYVDTPTDFLTVIVDSKMAAAAIRRPDKTGGRL